MALVGISIFECIEKFKKYCLQTKNWKVYENTDLIRASNKLHQFVWVNHLNQYTFEAMIRNPTCATKQGCSYRIRNIDFIAFVLPQTPSGEILNYFEEISDVPERVALYDLSHLLRKESVCTKLNKTKSQVFSEFEKFLTKCYGTRFEPISFLEFINP